MEKQNQNFLTEILLYLKSELKELQTMSAKIEVMNEILKRIELNFSNLEERVSELEKNTLKKSDFKLIFVVLGFLLSILTFIFNYILNYIKVNK